mgnify:CR=1 FL=1
MIILKMEERKMIGYETIVKAQNGDENSINEIINYYKKKIDEIYKDEDFTQIATFEIYKAIFRFKNEGKYKK